MQIKNGSTILIPAYNRYDDLNRLLHYCKDNFNPAKVRILVLDGSDRAGEAESIQAACKRCSIEYRFYTADVTYQQRILSGLECVETETVVLLGDDDILYPQGFVDCVTFLEEHPEYAIAHGQYIAFDFRKNGLSYNPTYQSESVEDDSPLVRLFSFFSAYVAPTYYAVNRTQYLRASFGELVANGTEFKDYVSSELLVSAIPIANGKLKRLPSFYQARRFIPAPPDKYIVYAKYLTDESFSHRYQKLKQSIVKYLPQGMNVPTDTVSDAVDYAFAGYFGQRVSMKELTARFQMLKGIK